MTSSIQEALDRAALEGGGTVKLIAGEYLSGTIELRSGVTIDLAKGAVLKGSDSYADYRNDAFIYGKEVTGISITGSGTIDGADCINPKGEEGFRGPHCIKLNSCRNIVISGITIKNSANWAINCRYCSYGNVTNVTILGGHDGLHTRFCNNFRANGCDFRTGDDCFAGNDNRDFEISDCSINTSCNGFRLGCLNLKVRNCRFWGPGQYVHKSQNRHNMLSAFVHFSPKDEKPQLKSGNWIIEDIIVENVDNFFIYNFSGGLWQTGQPFTNAEFKNIRASGLLRSFYIKGDAGNPAGILIEKSAFSRRPGQAKTPESFEGAKLADTLFFSAGTFGKITLRRTQLSDREKEIIAQFSDGTIAELDKLSLESQSETQAFTTRSIGEAILKEVTQNGYDITGKKLKTLEIKR
jgi:hypothetical protein